jgi:hypothetical protein
VGEDVDRATRRQPLQQRDQRGEPRAERRRPVVDVREAAAAGGQQAPQQRRARRPGEADAESGLAGVIGEPEALGPAADLPAGARRAEREERAVRVGVRAVGMELEAVDQHDDRTVRRQGSQVPHERRLRIGAVRCAQAGVRRRDSEVGHALPSTCLN